MEVIDLELDGVLSDVDLLGDPRSLGPFRPGVTKKNKNKKKKKGQTKSSKETKSKIQKTPLNSKVLLRF